MGRWDAERLRVQSHKNFPRLRLGPDHRRPPLRAVIGRHQAEQLRQVPFCPPQVSTLYPKKNLRLLSTLF